MDVKVDAKKIHLMIKNGWTIGDFAEKYEISEKEFLEILEKSFGKKALEGMKRDFKTNERRKSKKRQVTNIQPESKIQPEPNKIELEESEKETVIGQESQDEQEEINEREGKELVLKELTEKASNIQLEICNAEASRARYFSERNKLRAKLKNEDKALFELQKEIEKHRRKVTDTINELYTINNSIDEVNEQISNSQKILSAIENEIRALKKEIIYVYSDGEVEIEGSVTFTVPEIWEKIYQEIRETECVEDITVKQIKLIAKLISFVKTLESFEISFEIETLQEIFETLYKMTEETA